MDKQNNGLESLNWLQLALVTPAIENIKVDLTLIGKWAETNVNTSPNRERDKDVIAAISRVDKAASVLLALGVKPEYISKLLSKHLNKTIQANFTIK